MNQHDPIDFAGADPARRLTATNDAALDALAFGVVEMDTSGVVRRYNRTESRYSGLPPERALARHFFKEVAPCCNNRRVAQRYEVPALDETIDYTFALRMKPVPVVLRMIRSTDVPDRMYLLVRWP